MNRLAKDYNSVRDVVELTFASYTIHLVIVLPYISIFCQACGVILLVSGFHLLMDEQRVLLSRLLIVGNNKLDLPEPLFYYIAMGLAIAGVVALIASMIGWWAACLNTYCLLSIVKRFLFKRFI